MKKLFFTLLSIAVLSVSAFAQTPVPANKPQEIVITVNQPPQPQPAPVVQEKEAVQKAHEWVEFGAHVGGAMREGLSALTDEANKFAGTDAGRFTMIVIAWKVMGDDAMTLLERFTHIAFGVPAFIVWTTFYIWFFRRKFAPHRVLISSDGPFWARKKTYKLINEELDWSGDAGAACLVSTVIWAIGACVIVFMIIL